MRLDTDKHPDIHHSVLYGINIPIYAYIGRRRDFKTDLNIFPRIL